MKHPVTLCGAALVLILVGAFECAGAPPAATDSRSLAGQWRFELDRADAGITERWFARTLREKIHLPGALQNQGFGDDVTADTKWTGDVGSDRWRQRPEYAKYREPGNIKIPFFLQPEKHYVGAAWYQRDIEIPRSWDGQRVVLTLERPHWGTHVWLDDRLIGTNLSLGTPHVYDLGNGVPPGRHTLTLRVDNRVLVEVGDWSHSVSDHTQGNWNGVVGRMDLSAGPPAWVDEIQVYPALAGDRLRVGMVYHNGTGKLAEGKISLSIEPVAGGPALEIPAFSQNFKTAGTDIPLTFELALGSRARTWDEFSPVLYRARLAVRGEINGRLFEQETLTTFGLRKLATTPDKQFTLNGRPVFFRGTLECCIFPKTGYPPTDVESWRRIIRICKAHGLNHIRFHSWCPPEAAFVAADELGFYYQVECGVWTQPGNGKAIDRWIYDESERIVQAYGNHPSFVLFTHGNEPHGPNREQYLAKWVDHWKRDGRFLVTSGSAYPQLPENQYHVHYPCRGPHGWLGKDYVKDVEKLSVPAIVHEMGQWCVFPNFDEVKKYTGPLKPKNFEIFRDSLTQHGLWQQRRDFLRASGELQVLCYKEEVEAAMRTPGIGGVQLLDLHDFPGQGTALVGVLDPFWEGKGYVTPEQFRRFYGPTVPLARLLKRNWTTDETLACDVEVAHFGPAPLTSARSTWRLQDARGRVVGAGAFPTRTIPLGRGTALGRVETSLARLKAPAAYRLVVKVGVESDHPSPAPSRQPGVENDWNVWVYPSAADATPVSDVLVSDAFEDSILARLDAGGRVLLATAKLSPAHPKLGFEPIFWNRYMFNTQGRQTLGLLIDAKHPALAQFPTESSQDWQWNDIVTQARAVILDELPRDLRPIVQAIDDWNTNRRLGLLFECRVGPGRLLVCAADLGKDLDQRPAARQLRNSLIAYAGSDRFKPKAAVSKDALVRTLQRAGKSTLANLGARVLSAGSEDSANGHLAIHAIDGDPDTFWHTRWQPSNDPMPHPLVIDLGREVTLKGLTCLPRQDQANGRIAAAAVYCSNDPASWGEPVARPKWPNTAELQKVDFARPVTARYLKFVVTAEVGGNPFASAAELDVLTADR